MEIFQTEVTVIELLLIVSLVAIVVQRLRIPYTVALVVVGLLLSAVQPLTVELTPDLILLLFVPPLVFEAALHLDLNLLKRNLPGILTLAIPGVIITTVIVGGIVNLTTGIEMPVALVFGALISATDPVAIISLFRTLGVPKALSVIVEAESLFNDGAAIVVFSLMVGYAVSGQFSMMAGVLDFVRVSVGGLTVGVVLGLAAAWVISKVDDHLIEITLTMVLAFGAYLAAESLHFSGVLAVVAAGLLNGNVGLRGMSPTTRIVLNNFWEYVAFLANSMIFLIIGLDITESALTSAWQPIAWAIVAVLIARIVVIYGFGKLINRFTEPISLKYQHVLAWGGLRGAIGLALALSLPFTMGSNRQLLLALTFGVVLFTLFVQGTTISILLRKLGIVKGSSESEIEYERRHARLATMQAAETHLNDMHRRGLISSFTWEEMKPEIQVQVTALSANLRDLLKGDPQLASEEMEMAHLEALRARRNALYEMRSHHIISEEAFESLVIELDQALVLANEAPEEPEINTEALVETTTPIIGSMGLDQVSSQTHELPNETASDDAATESVQKQPIVRMGLDLDLERSISEMLAAPVSENEALSDTPDEAPIDTAVVPAQKQRIVHMGLDQVLNEVDEASVESVSRDKASPERPTPIIEPDDV